MVQSMTFPTSPKAPVFVGDNLALDFLNTVFGSEPERYDCLVDDAAVLAWLAQAGALPVPMAGAPDGLHTLALTLRDNARALLDAARRGVAADASTLNQVLQDGRAYQQVQWNTSSASFVMVRRQSDLSAASLLEPVAQAVAALLCDMPLMHVRQCEASDCTLMFLDKTKSHRRRWCSMALCGNRMKVAAFRSRQKGA